MNKKSEGFSIYWALYCGISRGRVKRYSFFSNVFTGNITLCGGQNGLIGNALRHIHTHLINTFAASYLNTQGLNNSCLKSPASTLVDLTFQSRAPRSFSLNQLRNLSL